MIDAFCSSEQRLHKIVRGENKSKQTMKYRTQQMLDGGQNLNKTILLQLENKLQSLIKILQMNYNMIFVV